MNRRLACRSGMLFCLLGDLLLRLLRTQLILPFLLGLLAESSASGFGLFLTAAKVEP